jgi:hypothetical protein
MPRVPPELNLKIGPFSVSAKGAAAVRAIRWPVAFAVTLVVPVVGLAAYGLSYLGVFRFVLRRWWS